MPTKQQEATSGRCKAMTKAGSRCDARPGSACREQNVPPFMQERRTLRPSNHRNCIVLKPDSTASHAAQR
jgi:hypothetical protein